jgi:hypothetical protein
MKFPAELPCFANHAEAARVKFDNGAILQPREFFDRALKQNGHIFGCEGQDSINVKDSLRVASLRPNESNLGFTLVRDSTRVKESLSDTALKPTLERFIGFGVVENRQRPFHFVEFSLAEQFKNFRFAKQFHREVLILEPCSP